jgi:hypothetical protein
MGEETSERVHWPRDCVHVEVHATVIVACEHKRFFAAFGMH